MANPIDATINGNNLNSFGFVGGPQFTPTGLGLNTFGFLFPCDGIWGPADSIITTSWSGCTVGGFTIETCDD